LNIGEVIYTDIEEYDPNLDVQLNRSDFKRTPVRPRFPQQLSDGAAR
jgi:hypothetical protein